MRSRLGPIDSTPPSSHGDTLVKTRPASALRQFAPTTSRAPDFYPSHATVLHSAGSIGDSLMRALMILIILSVGAPAWAQEAPTHRAELLAWSSDGSTALVTEVITTPNGGGERAIRLISQRGPKRVVVSKVSDPSTVTPQKVSERSCIQRVKGLDQGAQKTWLLRRHRRRHLRQPCSAHHDRRCTDREDSGHMVLWRRPQPESRWTGAQP